MSGPTGPTTVPTYPRPGPEGRPEPAGWRRWAPHVLIPLLLIVSVCAVAALGLGFLKAVDPTGDEWVCSDGEAPAGNACYPVGEPLPPGLRWDPLGNRPMPYNCDQDGWDPIARDDGHGRDCLSVDLPVPAGWHVVDD